MKPSDKINKIYDELVDDTEKDEEEKTDFRTRHWLRMESIIQHLDEEYERKGKDAKN